MAEETEEPKYDPQTETGLVVTENGNKVWYLNGKIHREDGPAIEYANGDKEWWRYGQQQKRPQQSGPCGFSPKP